MQAPQLQTWVFVHSKKMNFRRVQWKPVLHPVNIICFPGSKAIFATHVAATNKQQHAPFSLSDGLRAFDCWRCGTQEECLRRQNGPRNFSGARCTWFVLIFDQRLVRSRDWLWHPSRLRIRGLRCIRFGILWRFAHRIVFEQLSLSESNEHVILKRKPNVKRLCRKRNSVTSSRKHLGKPLTMVTVLEQLPTNTRLTKSANDVS